MPPLPLTGYAINTQRLVAKLRLRAARAQKDSKAVVAVGYGAPYAIYVHEDLTMNHPNGGQAKYLEQAVRQQIDAIFSIVKRDLEKGNTMAQALLRAGIYLENESKKLVPVDTGELKRSAYTTLEAS